MESELVTPNTISCNVELFGSSLLQLSCVEPANHSLPSSRCIEVIADVFVLFSLCCMNVCVVAWLCLSLQASLVATAMGQAQVLSRHFHRRTVLLLYEPRQRKELLPHFDSFFFFLNAFTHEYASGPKESR